MSALSLVPPSMLESLGLSIVQKVADAALGNGVLTLSDDSHGIDAGLKLATGQTINIDDLTVNEHGMSGRLFIDGLTANPIGAKLLDGFVIELTAFDITLAQGGLAASHIGGHLSIPFFTDAGGNPKTVDVEITTRADGEICISLAAVETSQTTTSDGLVQLIYALPDGLGKIEIDVASLEVDKTVDGIWKVVLCGELIIEAASLSWPSIELRGLGIDSKGHVSLEGGWIDLPKQMALDFYGFHVALHKLGFGNDPSGKWIGFNGDIHLVEGLSLGGSVRGLRINLATGSVSLDGVSVSFKIPDVLTIDGEIDHIHVDAKTAKDLTAAGLMASLFDSIQPLGPNAPPGGKKVDVFTGQVKVCILAAGSLEIDANFIVGNFGGQSVFFLDIEAELPVGIPLFLDVSLYGLQGLVATGLEPHPEPKNTWWEWFKYPAGASGPDLLQKPDYSATDVNKWLVPKQGAFAIGAGATIGTSADDGFTVSAAITFVLLLPGPVISLIGKANILSKRLGSASQDANFEAMATYDGNAKTFDLSVDAHYSIPIVLDIEATAELYVGDGEWFFALGKPPHDKRVKARIFDLFESDTYFVISDHGLITGSWSGYKKTWKFGPLTASIDVYLATLAAVQWSPLQIAGGVEVYGNVYLKAFGIHIGLTADALLEACAPNPFWIHGEIHIEVDPPWPIPDISATLSLSWGGDDGTVPPAPLTLSRIDASLVDHTDSADNQSSDHYTLLAHRDQGFSPDLSVQYDPGKPGILALSGQSLNNWKTRIAASPILPDLDPANPPALQSVPVLPQDAHFVLNFAHPTVDATAAFDNAIAWSAATFPKDADIASPPPPPPPNQIGKDDMSNINPNPPSVPFIIRHSLTAVELYRYDQPQKTWGLVCATPPHANSHPLVGVTQLSGVWLSGDPSKANSRQVMTKLKVFPWRLLPGQEWTARWSADSVQQSFGKSFADQGLQFAEGPGLNPAIIGSLPTFGILPGLLISIDGSVNTPTVTISFPTPSVLTSLSAFEFHHSGEFNTFNAPQCFGDGKPLVPQSSSQDAVTQIWTLNFDNSGLAISTASIAVEGSSLLLYKISYATRPVPMAILPTAPALYALKTVTKIEAARVGAPTFQTVPNGDPIVEFVYFQTASGPGTAVGYPAPARLPSPNGPALWPNLAKSCNSDQQPPAAFPRAGGITDLHSYTQWSWPIDGVTNAYYGYDLNVEFVESYVNALYTAFSNGSVTDSLHFRCVERNNRHTALEPIAIHVPSIPQESALVASVMDLKIPKQLQPVPYDPKHPVTDRHQLTENSAAQEILSLWFKPLLPQTRYTLDVVAGPWFGLLNHDTGGISSDSLPAVLQAADPMSGLAALKAYFAHEDALTTLQRVQFATSRYATFSDHLANGCKQLAGAAGATPIRHYKAITSPASWLGSAGPQTFAWVNAGAKYLQDMTALQSLVAAFDPLADNRQPGIVPAVNGAAALVAQRRLAAADWVSFSQASNKLFDGVIAAMGYVDFASKATPVRPPDTEISLFTDATGQWVEAIQIESPEPLPWQRVWRGISLAKAGATSAAMVTLWNVDGTRGLVVPLQQLSGPYALTVLFQGNIGCQSPCITLKGSPIAETVSAGVVKMGPVGGAPSRLPNDGNSQRLAKFAGTFLLK